MLVFDCGNYGVPSVQVTVSSADMLTQGFDTTSFTRTTTTDHTGAIIFVDVLPGFLQVTATPAGLKGPSGTVSVAAHAGATTVVLLRPTP